MGQEVSTGKVLSDMFATQRQMTRYYLSKLRDFDPHTKVEVDGTILNSTYWIVAHLIWAEDYLLLRCLGHEGTGIEWLDQFKVGSDSGLVTLNMDFKHLLNLQKDVHQTTLAHLASMSEKEFSEDNALDIQFGGEKSKRYIAMHGIRHEGVHAGQLSVIGKILGSKAI